MKASSMAFVPFLTPSSPGPIPADRLRFSRTLRVGDQSTDTSNKATSRYCSSNTVLQDRCGCEDEREELRSKE